MEKGFVFVTTVIVVVVEYLQQMALTFQLNLQKNLDTVLRMNLNALNY